MQAAGAAAEGEGEGREGEEAKEGKERSVFDVLWFILFILSAAKSRVLDKETSRMGQEGSGTKAKSKGNKKNEKTQQQRAADAEQR